MRSSVVLSVAAVMGCAAYGQKPSPQPAFEVASVKPAAVREEPAGMSRSTGMPPQGFSNPGLVNYSNVSLDGVLSRAYDLLPGKIVGPSWLDTERYDIVARVPKDAPAGQIPLMLQNLLAERFRMRAHWETKQTSGFALVVGKSGPKLTKSTLEDPTRHSLMVNGSGHLAWKGETLDGFANSLSVDLGKPVENKTGIEGIFDITIDAAPDSLPGLHFGTPSEESASLPSIFAAVRKLGLELEPRQVTLKQLIVDSAQKIPTPN